MRALRTYSITCAGCGVTCIGKTVHGPDPKYCSRACLGAHFSRLRRGILMRKSPQLGASNPSWRGGTKQLICVICGRKFTRKANVTKYQPTCSKACGARHKGNNQRGKEVNPPSHITCRGCGEKFYGKGQTRHKLYCSSGCYFRHSRFSYPQTRLTDELRSLGFTVESEKRWPWLVNPQTGGRLAVDIYLPLVGLAIEYDGQQHKIGRGGNSLALIQQRDAAKDMLLRRMGIPLLRISPFRSNARAIATAIRQMIRLAGMDAERS